MYGGGPATVMQYSSLNATSWTELMQYLQFTHQNCLHNSSPRLRKTFHHVPKTVVYSRVLNKTSMLMTPAHYLTP
jgi:hypothetical protein